MKALAAHLLESRAREEVDELHLVVLPFMEMSEGLEPRGARADVGEIQADVARKPRALALPRRACPLGLVQRQVLLPETDAVRHAHAQHPARLERAVALVQQAAAVIRFQMFPELARVDRRHRGIGPRHPAP